MRDTINAILESTADGARLQAPRLGHYTPFVHRGDFVRPGTELGELRVLNRRYLVLAPHGTTGIIEDCVTPPGRGVEYKETLAALGATLDMSASSAAVRAAEEDAAAETAGLAVRAPIHGIFYGRPSPGAELYVKPGDIIAEGQTVGLVEVMKTFNPVVYGGAGLPERARVLETVAKDQQEVEAGETLLTVEAG